MHGDTIQPGRHGIVEGAVQGYRVHPSSGFGEQYTLMYANLRDNNATILPGTWSPVGTPEHNEVMYDWGSIVGELLRGAPDGKSYKIGGMYLEFENNGGGAVTPPAFDRTGGKDYYDDLLVHATIDYLRVPLTASQFSSSDEELFPRNNLITFFAQSSGIVGVHGKTFSHTVSSRVFGGALVAYPVFGDQTQDLVFSRFYFSSSNQLVKQQGSQIGLSWPLTLR